MQRWTGASPNTFRIAFLSAFEPSITNSWSLLGIQAALDQIRQQRGRDRRVLRRSFPEPKRDLHTLRGDSERHDVRAALQLYPVEHQHRQPDVIEPPAHQLRERLARTLDEAARDRRLRCRAGGSLNRLADRLGRAAVAATRDAGQHPLQDDSGQRIAVGEVLVGRKPHLARVVCRPDSRTLDLDPAPTKRHLARGVAVAYRLPVRVMTASRADHLVDFLFHQLAQNAKPNTHAQCEQSLPGSSNQLAERLLDALGQDGLGSDPGLRERYGCLLHGGSSFDLWRIASNASMRSGRG
jgi:hypothetical protein